MTCNVNTKQDFPEDKEQTKRETATEACNFYIKTMFLEPFKIKYYLIFSGWFDWSLITTFFFLFAKTFVLAEPSLPTLSIQANFISQWEKIKYL